MRKLLITLLGGVALTAVTFGTPSLTWSSVRDEVRQFHVFLQDHPKVSTELRNNPKLVNKQEIFGQTRRSGKIPQTPS